ncbi:MAG: RNA polymerase sigma factor [Gammaproteobacteria bacterium]
MSIQSRHGMARVKWIGVDRRSPSREVSLTSDNEGTLQRALSGDHRAIGELVNRLTPVIHARVARKLLGTGSYRDMRQDTKDFAQEIFLSLFQDGAKKLKSWQADRGMSLENFVGLISERHVISALRSGKRNPWREREALEEAAEPVSLSAEVEAQIIHSDHLGTLLDRLRVALSPQGWQLFELLYIEECSVAEVQDKTGLKSDAIYAWRSRLRKQAKQCQFELQQEETDIQHVSRRINR